MNETELNNRLISYGFRRDELADKDRLPEQLILSHLAETPSTAPELESQRWWKDRARRMDLAFHRLRASQQIDFSGGRWRASQTVERGESADRPPTAAPGAAGPKPKQRSLF